jgi:hypothetical protein
MQEKGNKMQQRTTWMALLACMCLPVKVGATDVHPHIAANLLPMSLQVSWNSNKPQLGKFGQCAAAFDSRTDDGKMAFACSIYVKLSAVAQRKAIQHCDEQREARHIKAPCQLIDK